MNPNSDNILVLCTGNSCRSQMAEGFIKKILPKANVFSAGIETHGVNTKAIEVMSEIGIDISTHTSNQLEEYREIKFTHIITVCDNANETCPYFLSGGKKYHHNFSDPTKFIGTEIDKMNEFRRTRDMIGEYLNQIFHIYDDGSVEKKFIIQ